MKPIRVWLRVTSDHSDIVRVYRTKERAHDLSLYNELLFRATAARLFGEENLPKGDEVVRAEITGRVIK